MSRLDPVRIAVSEQAAEWYITQRAERPDAAGRKAFLLWLAESPVNVEEYLRIAQISQGLNAAARTPKVAEQELLGSLAGLRNEIPGVAPARQIEPAARWFAPPRPGWGVVGIALAGAGLLLAVAWRPFSGTQGLYATSHGQQATHTLADGSILRMNTDTRVRVTYTGQERSIELLQGEAFFSVAHETRPFRVAAGAANVLAVGTKFDVYRKGSKSFVTVTEGVVALFPEQRRWPWSGYSAPADALRLRPGTTAEIDASGRPGGTGTGKADRSLAWLEHRIVFDRWSLQDVADEFNRYGEVPLAIEDPSLRALLVSGHFDASDVDSFLAYLSTLDGVAIRRSPARIVVSRPDAAH